MKCFPEYDFPGNGRSRMSIAHQNLRVSIKTSQGDTLKFFDVLVGRSSGKTLLDFFFLTDHQSSDPYEIEEKCDQDFFFDFFESVERKITKSGPPAFFTSQGTSTKRATQFSDTL